MLIVMRHGARRGGHPSGSSRPSRRWATRRGRCRASSAPPSAWSATTAGSTAPAWPRCPASRKSSTSPSPTSRCPASGKPESTIVRLPGGLTIGGDEVVVMAGPCSVESERQILAAARAVREAGATVLRAGAFKPRSSPYSFQGLGRCRARAAGPRARGDRPPDRHRGDGRRGPGRRCVEVADIVQIGARNMQNYSLLKHAGRVRQAGAAQARPVRHHPGAAALGRVHPGRGQSAR